MRARPLVVFDRLDLWEWRFCQRVTHLSLYRPWRLTLKTASKLGDWPVWVLLIAAQPWLQPDGTWRMMQYSLIALVAVTVYKLVKTKLCRERPFITYLGGVHCGEPARDRYSFPSGHTMISRVGLGLHYVSDVLVGGVMGYGFALLSLYWMG